MDATSSHVSSPSPVTAQGPEYEVFLSFRGPDTRKHFADFLYHSLNDARIRVFRDEEDLPKGREINPELIKAINQSVISIPVISKDYASSKSCLMELEELAKRSQAGEHVIIPVFYYVNPSDVRHSRGLFQKALEGKGKRRIDGDPLNNIESALRHVGQLKGFHLQESDLSIHHGNIVKAVVRDVMRKLRKEDLEVTKELLGIEKHLEDIMGWLKVDYRSGTAVKLWDSQREVVGIHGLPGSGKTTLAKHVYNQLYHLFDGCCYLGNIRGSVKNGSSLSLQNRLIADLGKGHTQKYECPDKALIFIRSRFHTMSALLLLDDVDNSNQLTELFGELDWLGPGSRIILTSQRQDILKTITGARNFVLPSMEEEMALRLFCRHAFGQDSPREKFEDLSKKIVSTTGGLPLALKVVGSSLFLKNKKLWKEKWQTLKKAPHDSVQDALETSYSDLNKNEKEIFLDIACFFTGKDKRIPHYMWQDCEYSPSGGIEALHCMSLIEIGENKELYMHEMLKSFAREKVKNESRENPHKRSRLWEHHEALHVLKRRKGSESIVGLELAFGDGSSSKVTLHNGHFHGLENLRFLKLDEADIRGNFHLPSLKWLDWRGCPKAFEIEMNIKDLIILDLSWSQVDQDWPGWKLIAKAEKLKVLNLTGCVQLDATPKFVPSMKLERLILKGCSRLSVIDPSFSRLKDLVFLNLQQCGVHDLSDLGRMPALKELLIDGTCITEITFREGSMRNLKILSARNCEHLVHISDSVKNLKSLRSLALDGSKVSTLGVSIEKLENLQTLSLKKCRNLSDLPHRIGELKSLVVMDLSDTLIQKLPSSVKDLENLKVLRMRGCFLYEFPEAIKDLDKLEEIDFSFCRSLQGPVCCDFTGLSSLMTLNLSYTQISALSETISSLSHLRTLDVYKCERLHSLPILPPNLVKLRWHSDLESEFESVRLR